MRDKSSTKKIRKNVNKYLFYTSCVIFGLTYIPYVFLSKSQMKDDALLTVLQLCLAIIFSVIFVCGVIYLSSCFGCEYTEEGVFRTLGKWRYRKVLYEEVLGITIRGAVNYYLFPITDEEKKQKAVITGYASARTFFSALRKDGISFMPFGYENESLFRSYLKEEDIKKLLLYTNATIYITEEMLNVHMKLLKYIFEEYSNRIQIACYDSFMDSNEFLTFSEYMKSNTR